MTQSTQEQDDYGYNVPRKLVVPITVDAAGDATVYSPLFTGYVDTIQYVKDDFADGVDFTITDEDTGENIWADTNINASETVHPTRLDDDLAGADRATVSRHLMVQNRLEFIIAAGGVSKSGSFTVLIG